ncbi:hypothetical protein [Mesobacillus maritimus]|nr:hypothetical protein [Mesobacillus maritimus]
MPFFIGGFGGGPRFRFRRGPVFRPRYRFRRGPGFRFRRGRFFY